MIPLTFIFSFFFFNDTATTEIYTLSLHDALPILIIIFVFYRHRCRSNVTRNLERFPTFIIERSEEHTSELQSRLHLVCRLLLEKKKKKSDNRTSMSSSSGPEPPNTPYARGTSNYC